MKNKIIVMCAVVAVLSACGPTPQPVQQAPVAQVMQPMAAPVAAAGQPIIINQPAPAAHSGSDGMLTGALVGGAVGYMAGSAGNRSNNSYDRGYRAPNRTTVINKTVVVNKYVQPKKASKPSSFGSFKSRRK